MKIIKINLTKNIFLYFSYETLIKMELKEHFLLA